MAKLQLLTALGWQTFAPMDDCLASVKATTLSPCHGGNLQAQRMNNALLFLEPAVPFMPMFQLRRYF